MSIEGVQKACSAICASLLQGCQQISFSCLIQSQIKHCLKQHRLPALRAINFNSWLETLPLCKSHIFNLCYKKLFVNWFSVHLFATQLVRNHTGVQLQVSHDNFVLYSLETCNWTPTQFTRQLHVLSWLPSQCFPTY